MNNRSWVLALAVSIPVFVAGCAFLNQSSHTGYERHDQALLYDEPFDYIFLKTLEALSTFPDWVFEETDKEQGLIILRNVNYGHLLDRDKELASFRVTRVSRERTSVMLEPDSQEVRQGGIFLKRIDQFISRAEAAPSESLAEPAGS